MDLSLENLQMGTLEKAKAIVIEKLIYLRLVIEYDDEIDETDMVEFKAKFNKIFRAVISGENTIRYALHLQNAMIESDIGYDDQLDITKYTPMDTSNNNAYQNLLLFLLENLLNKGFRKYQSDCYARVYTPEGNDTHCWKRVMSLREFIYKTIRKEIYYEMWQNLTHAKGNDKEAIKYLENYEGMEFEEIKKDRHVFAFRNGIYISKKWNEDLERFGDEWVPYTGKNSKKIGSSIVACKYFDFNFDEETRADLKDPDHIYNDWWNIIVEDCPFFKSVMDYQEWGEDVQKWLCMLMGRCLYEIGELDDWQVMGFLLGQAGKLDAHKSIQL